MNPAVASLSLAALLGAGAGAGLLVESEPVPEASRRPPSMAARWAATGVAGATASEPGPAARGAVAVRDRPPSPAAAPTVRGRWRWPLLPRPPVVRRFVPPASTWGAGHRGVDLAATPRAVVLSVADGTVSHTGVVAGRPTVTVTHPSGLRSTYEPVQPTVATGDAVRAGDPVGVLVSTGSHCAPKACLHLGALRGATYLDPLTLLGPQRVRLLPLSSRGHAPAGQVSGG